MYKKIAYIISTIFHPLVMPIYLLIYILYGNTPWALLPSAYKTIVITYIGIGTSIMPLVVIGAFILMHITKDAEMNSRSERVFPLIFSCFSAWLTVYFVYTQMHLPLPIVRLTESVAAMLTVASVITPFWKISLHSIGTGALLVFVIILGCASRIDFGASLIISIALSGIVIWARLYLKSHTPMQLLVGYIVGAVVMFVSMIH